MRKRIICVLIFLWTLSAISSGLLAAVERVGTDSDLYFELQMKAGILDFAGISESTLKQLDSALAEYLAGSTYALVTPEGASIPAEVFGQTQPAFNERELAHMADCQNLFLTLSFVLNAVRRFAVHGLLIVVVLTLLATSKSDWPSRRQLTRSAMLAPLALLIPLGAFALWAAIDFSGAFTFFHHLLFANDLWLLDPRTDLLIRICPSSMFASMGLRIGARALLWMVGAPAAACGITWLIAKVKESLK